MDEVMVLPIDEANPALCCKVLMMRSQILKCWVAYLFDS